MKIFTIRFLDVGKQQFLKMYKMNLNNKIISINFNTIDLIKEVKYEREIGREFYQEPGSDSARDSKREKRPLRIGKWCRRIFNF